MADNGNKKCPRIFEQSQYFERNQYFEGKLLTSSDLKAEQEYFRKKHALINRLIHGSGIVCGLELKGVAIKGEELVLTIAPGVALDGFGRELVVPKEKPHPKPLAEFYEEETTKYCVYLTYDECDTKPSPSLTDLGSCKETCKYGRKRETYNIVVKPMKPAEMDLCDPWMKTTCMKETVDGKKIVVKHSVPRWVNQGEVFEVRVQAVIADECDCDCDKVVLTEEFVELSVVDGLKLVDEEYKLELNATNGETKSYLVKAHKESAAKIDSTVSELFGDPIDDGATSSTTIDVISGFVSEKMIQAYFAERLNCSEEGLDWSDESSDCSERLSRCSKETDNCAQMSVDVKEKHGAAIGKSKCVQSEMDARVCLGVIDIPSQNASDEEDGKHCLSASINKCETRNHRRFVYNNTVLYKLIACLGKRRGPQGEQGLQGPPGQSTQESCAIWLKLFKDALGEQILIFEELQCLLSSYSHDSDRESKYPDGDGRERKIIAKPTDRFGDLIWKLGEMRERLGIQWEPSEYDLLPCESVAEAIGRMNEICEAEKDLLEELGDKNIMLAMTKLQDMLGEWPNAPWEKARESSRAQRNDEAQDGDKRILAWAIIQAKQDLNFELKRLIAGIKRESDIRYVDRRIQQSGPYKQSPGEPDVSAAQSQGAVESFVVCNKSTGIYHQLDCKMLIPMLSKNKERVPIGEAKEKNMRPCTQCHRVSTP